MVALAVSLLGTSCENKGINTVFEFMFNREAPESVREPEDDEMVLREVVNFGGKQLPVDQLEKRTGPDCTRDGVRVFHWHAKVEGGVVIALDGTSVIDPGSCAFGVVTENPSVLVPVLKNPQPAK